MKRCPNCREKVQDAATICPQCGQTLPETANEPGAAARLGRALVWIAGAAVLLFVAYKMFLPHPDARLRDAGGRCLLRARVYTFGELTSQPRRIFGVQNQDEADWTDVQFTITGVPVAGPSANKPTGPYVLTLPDYDSSIAAKKAREVPLDDFQSPDGPRWVPLTMRVTDVKVTAKIAGETCTYEGPLEAGAAK